MFREYSVKIGEDFVSISDREGEIVRWVLPEWVEDPKVVLSIANAVKLAEQGLTDMRKLLQVKKP